MRWFLLLLRRRAEIIISIYYLQNLAKKYAIFLQHGGHGSEVI